MVLDKDSSFRGYEDLDIVPPAEGKAVVELTPEAVQANAVRLAREDSLRVAYIAGFDTSDPYLAKARGNWREIAAYMEASRSSMPCTCWTCSARRTCAIRPPGC